MSAALTKEEWERHLGRVYDISGELDTQGRPHALAALCLHGQPFGFTREDVKVLREIHRYVRDGIEPCDQYDDSRILAIASRIEALLPPEESK